MRGDAENLSKNAEYQLKKTTELAQLIGAAKAATAVHAEILAWDLEWIWPCTIFTMTLSDNDFLIDGPTWFQLG